MKTNGRIQLFPFFRVAIALILGIVAGESSVGCIPIIGLYATLIGILTAVFLVRKFIFQSVMLLFATFVLGMLLVCLEESRLSVNLPEDEKVYEAVITSQPVERGKTVQFDMVVVKGLNERPLKAKAWLLKDSVKRRYLRLNVGDGITALSKFHQPENRFATTRFNHCMWMKTHGFTAETFIYYCNWEKSVVDLRALSLLERTRIVLLAYRQTLLKQYKTIGLDSDAYAIVAAMTLGDKSFVSRELKDTYAISGASHVLALSGLHLGIIYALFIMLGLRRRGMAGILLLLTSVWAYALLVGLSSSVVRAAVMLSVYAFFSLGHREKMSLNVLSFTACIMLVCHPLALYDAGFQLSFCSMLSITLLFKPLYRLFDEKWLACHRFVASLWSMTLVSFTAQIGVTPLIAYYFGRFSCYFLLTNFVAVPLATAILYLSFLFFTVGQWSVVRLLFLKVMSAIIHALNTSLNFIAHLPYASVEGINLSVWQVAMLYWLIVCVCLLCRYTLRPFQPKRDMPWYA